MSKINLSPNFSIPAIDYAGQGNAVLGIRDAGKTYTAMKLAEGLMENNIPIIVYDPVGVWKNLKIGTGQHKGYPVVTAGGSECDIILTAVNAPNVVRAAMKENVNLVIDLYSPELINKSTWIRIVQETIDILMYENKQYGMRHIFIEEAAEFIPQRLQPQHARVYSSIERLARMGRNARLGYTIINQRAEEINKAILEISSLSLLHKQVGKNSLLSISKWLDLLQLDNKSEIIKSLPGLKQGQCWVVGIGDQPHLIQVSPKKSFHPDPKKSSETIDAAKKKVDVSVFVEKLNKLLVKPVVTDTVSIVASTKDAKNITKLHAEVSALTMDRDRLRNVIRDLTNELEDQKQLSGEYKKQLDSIRKILSYEPVLKLRKNGTKHPVHETNSHKSETMPGLRETGSASKAIADFHISGNLKASNLSHPGKLGKCSTAILQFLAQYSGRSFTKAQISVATGYSSGSGGFNNSLSELNTAGLIVRDGTRIAANTAANITEWIGAVIPKQYSIETYKGNLGKCEAEVYQVLLNNPQTQFTKEELAHFTETQYSSSSGGFNNSISRLNTLELIKRNNGRIQLNPELLEI